MKNIGKEIAKAATGFAACETIGHWWIGLSGDRFLPIDLGWFTFTREMNQIVMIAWPLILVALIVYAWGIKPKDRTTTSDFGRSVPA